jgi:hypothetical protein
MSSHEIESTSFSVHQYCDGVSPRDRDVSKGTGELIMNTTTRLAIVPLGLTLSSFFLISYVLCILYGLAVSDAGFHRTLLPMLIPGFTWISWYSFVVGLIWSVVFGWYVAVVFAPLYNFFAARSK